MNDHGTGALLDFINASPTAFHATANAAQRLESAGFSALQLADKWTLERGGKYYVTQNGSALLAFIIGQNDIAESGMRLIAAHTDSPCFQVKPNAEIRADGRYVKLNTAVYGGPILSTWFDRPLCIAGRVLVKSGKLFAPESILVNIRHPVLVIPSLAVHFSDKAGSGALNTQKDTLPLAGFIDDALEKDETLLRLLCEETGKVAADILDFDLFLYESEPGRRIGAQSEFISASRLDDLWMVHAGLDAITNAPPAAHTSVLLCADAEEVGSRTLAGAESAFARECLERVVRAFGGAAEDFSRAAARSFLLSADLAHAVHPNFGEIHDPTTRPVLGKGPVVKYSVNRRYATDGVGAAVFHELCRAAGVPCQSYVNRSDIAGGSTIGAALASQFAARTADVGAAVLAMHSIRELGAAADNEYTCKAFRAFYTLH